MRACRFRGVARRGGVVGEHLREAGGALGRTRYPSPHPHPYPRSHLLPSLLPSPPQGRSAVLSSLEQVILALQNRQSDSKSGASSASAAQHIPYRNSKLTLLLSDALGAKGTCAKTLPFLHVSPCASSAPERRAPRFGSGAPRFAWERCGATTSAQTRRRRPRARRQRSSRRARRRARAAQGGGARARGGRARRASG